MRGFNPQLDNKVLIINFSPKIVEVARSDGGARCGFKANLW